MSAEKVLEGTEAHISQIGVVVKDLDKTIEYLTSLGLGPFSIYTINNRAVHLRLAISQQGPVELELIEYKRGKTIHKQFLEERGEGLHHIQFRVRNLKDTVKKFAEKGIGVTQYAEFVEGGGLAYMGTDEIGGIIIEVVKLPPNFDYKNHLAFKED